jgi:transposase-like protein
MHSNETKNEFVKLRAGGWSYSRISTQLKVSRQTLLSWNRQFQSKLRSPRTIELEALQASLVPEEEMIRSSMNLRAVEQELASRAFRQFTTPQLHRFAALLSERLSELNPVKEQSNSGQVRSNSAPFCIGKSRLVKDENFF